MIKYFTDFYVIQVFGLSGVTINNYIAATVPFLCDKFPKRGKQIPFFILKILLCVITMNILCAISYALFDHVAMSQICGGTLVIVYLLVFSSSPIKNKLISTTAFMSTIEVALLAGFSVFDIASGHNIPNSENNYEFSWILVLIFMMVLIAACIFFFRAFSPDKLSEVQTVSVYAETVSFAICTGFWLITNVTSVDSVTQLSISLILIVLLLSAYYFSFELSKRVEETKRRQADELLKKADKNMLSIIENNVEELKKLRHEIENQYSYMKILLDSGNYEKLDEYLSTFVERIPLSVFVYCDNKVISATIGMEIQKAEKYGITIDYMLAVPEKINIADYDLCSLVFNILNNAIEYLSKKDDILKTIYFSLKLENKALVLCAKNAIADEDKENALLLKTTKSNKNIHGYGSKVVQSIAKRYNGQVEYAAENGFFGISALLFEKKV